MSDYKKAKFKKSKSKSKSKSTKQPKKLIENIKNRLSRSSYKSKGQIGGDCTPSTSGDFDNMIGQLTCMIEEGIQSITSGIETAYSVITLPADLEWDMNRPNEPMPSNTPIPTLHVPSFPI